MADEKKIAHLGFIQGVINRMGNNSFLVKGWTVALVAAIFALSSKEANQSYIYIALLPITVFWVLDSYYLRQEKLFRKLYDEVVKAARQLDEFTMNTSIFTAEIKPVFCLMFTISTFPFYFLITGILLFVALKGGDWFIFESIKHFCQK